MANIRKIAALVIVMVAQVGSAVAAGAMPIEPRSLTWNIVSDREMSRICRDHGLRENCEGMAAWDKGFRMCIICNHPPKAAGR